MTAARRFLPAMFAIATVALMMLFHAGTASAQCPTTTVTNNTGVTIKLIIYDNTGASFGISVPPAGTTIIPQPNPFAGIVSAGGIQYAFAPNCTPCITVNTAFMGPTQCVIVCYNPATCVMAIMSCNAPCNP